MPELFAICSGRPWFILDPLDEPIRSDEDFLCGEFNSLRRLSFMIDRESCLYSLSLILTYKVWLVSIPCIPSGQYPECIWGFLLNSRSEISLTFFFFRDQGRAKVPWIFDPCPRWILFGEFRSGFEPKFSGTCGTLFHFIISGVPALKSLRNSLIQSDEPWRSFQSRFPSRLNELLRNPLPAMALTGFTFSTLRITGFSEVSSKLRLMIISGTMSDVLTIFFETGSLYS